MFANIIVVIINMALSKSKNVNLSVVLTEALTERYFNTVFQKYGIAFPEDNSCNVTNKDPSLNGYTKVLQEVPNMLFEIADLFENARVEELVKKCERLRLNSGNLYSQFAETISTLLDNGITWGKESLLKFGKETLSHKNEEIRRKEIVKQLGQVGMVLGVFAAAAFAVKHIFV